MSTIPPPYLDDMCQPPASVLEAGVVTVDSIGGILSYLWGMRAHQAHTRPAGALRVALTVQSTNSDVIAGLSVQLTPDAARELTQVLCDAIAGRYQRHLTPLADRLRRP